MTRLFGVEDDFGEDAILGRLEGMKDVIEQVNQQFRDPVRPLVYCFATYLNTCGCISRSCCYCVLNIRGIT